MFYYKILKIFLFSIFIILVFSLIACSYNTDEMLEDENLSYIDLKNKMMEKEIINIELENRVLNSFWGRNSSLTTLITASVALVGLLITIWKYISQRRLESLQKIEEEFNLILANLGSDNKLIRTNASVSIITFIKSKYSNYYEQIYMILLSNLKIKPGNNYYDEIINKLLIRAFEKIIRIRSSLNNISGDELNFSSAQMEKINLSGLSLKNLNLDYTNLENANLCGTNFSESEGKEINFEYAKFNKKESKISILKDVRFNNSFCYRAEFEEANLIATHFKDTDLRNSTFKGALLQSAHFEGAELNAAIFEQANINDTYFEKAILDDAALKSILTANNWNKAHFSKKHRERLSHLLEMKKNKL